MIRSEKFDDEQRILVINYEFPPLGGGGGVATYELAVEWAKKARVDVVTSAYGDLPHYEFMDNINVYRTTVLMRNSRDAASFVSMLTFLISGFFQGIVLFRENRYHVINTHFAVPSGPLGFILGKMFNTPNVLSLHGGDIYDPSKKMSPHKSPFFKRVVRFILNHADVIVAQSSNTHDNAVKYYAPKKEIKIIPLAFHPPVVPPPDKKALGFKDSDFVIVSIGRVVKRKAYDVLIQAVASLGEKSKVKLVIVGDGPERPVLEMLADELGIKEKVVFTGFVSNEEKYAYLSSADLFALTSLHEGFGIVFMEAMYCGLPIVCTNHGGQVDFLESEKNALLIDVNDVEACAESIKRFMKDEKLYARCVKNNRMRVKDFYAESVASQYQAVFNMITTGENSAK